MNHHPDIPGTENFAAVTDFLNAFAPEVSGRSSDVVTPELEQQLKSLAAGNLSEDEGRELSRELLANENAMQALAGFIQANQ